MKTPAFREPAFGYAVAALSTALLTGVLWSFRNDVGLLNVGLLFVLLTLLVASGWGKGAGLFAAFTVNLSLNFFFVEPYYRFNVEEPRNILALVVFLVVSVVGGTLLSTAREAAAQARRRQAETEVALTLSREMSGQTEPDAALRQLCRSATRAFDAPGAAVLTNAAGRWTVLAHAGDDASAREPSLDERAAADRAATSGAFESLGQTGLSRNRARVVFPGGRKAAYSGERSVALVPLRVGERVLGVLRLDGPIGNTPFREHPEALLSAVAGEAALAVERGELAHAAAHAEALREADELKSALLNAVSHDLRSPLASIIAAAGSLQQTDVAWTEEEQLDFAEAIDHEAQRLDRLVGNLLDLSRIESGSLKPDKGLYDLGTLVGEVLARLQPVTAAHRIVVEIADDLPPVPLDYIEIDEVLTNLVENATKYAPPGTEIAVSAKHAGDAVVVAVSDRGPGIPAEALMQVFESFYRVKGSKARGTGLGLAVARGLVAAHGGRIWAENRDGGGAQVSFTLPLTDAVSQPESVTMRRAE